jgi:hypothetical protein
MNPGDWLYSLEEEASVNVVESYLLKLERHGAGNLALPSKKIRSAGLGGEAALIQFLLSWARQSPGGIIKVPVSLADDADVAHSLKHLSHRAYSFVGMLSAADVVAEDGVTSIREKTNLACSRRVDELSINLARAKFGHRTFLPCVDHSTKAFIPAYYFPDGRLRNRQEFTELADELLSSRAEAFAQNSIAEATRRGLGLMLHELVKNTHDWGRTGTDNVRLRPSIRGLLFTRQSPNKAGALGFSGGNQSLLQYIREVASKSPDDYVRLLELSIFDSGPGLASRWLSRQVNDQLPLQDEAKACFDCLRKHQTTSGASNRGMGLYDVMKILQDLRAYIRIRTGRLAMYRDFLANPLEQKESTAGPILFDWKTCKTDFSKMAPVAGTLFTIVIPVWQERA